MLRATELAGFIGAGLAGAAYVPQIAHLIRAHCSAGISQFAFGVWLAASLLVTTHAVAIRAAVFVALGVVQLVATALVLIYATKYENSYCTIHLPRSLEPEPAPGLASRRAGEGGGAPAQLAIGPGSATGGCTRPRTPARRSESSP